MYTSPKSVNSYPQVMTVPEMADMLRIGRNTAYRLVRDGDVPSVKVGRQVRVFRDDVISHVFFGNASLEKPAG